MLSAIGGVEQVLPRQSTASENAFAVEYNAWGEFNLREVTKCPKIGCEKKEFQLGKGTFSEVNVEGFSKITDISEKSIFS